MEILSILKKVADMRATDLHLVVGMRPVCRIGGRLTPIADSVLTPEDTEQYVRTLLSAEQWKALRNQGELDFSLSVRGLNRFRVNVFRQRGTYSISCRLVLGEIPDFEALGLPQALRELCHRDKGLILVTGPAGCGKSTTLASMVDYINNNRDLHIITLEDPIEFFHRHKRCIVNQREIGNDSHTYATALHAALRQDPDVILVGEIMDLETISVALAAAETGVLVLAALHTPGTVQAIDRLIDVFPPMQQQQVRVQIAMLLQGVLYQQLIPSVSGSYISAVEMLLATQTVRNLIRESKTQLIPDLLNSGSRDGMCSMDTALVELYRAGHITRENALKYASEPGRMNQLLIQR